MFHYYWIFFVLASTLVDAAPYKSKNKKYDGPQLVYDQKQTGDYNIQLHLKDFQIIAMLGDEALGDYEYDYDYADFTIKPSGSSSTSASPKPSSTAHPKPTSTASPKPTSAASPSSTTQIILSSSSQLPPSTTLTPIKEISSESSTSVESSSSSETVSSSSTISNAHPYPIEGVISTQKPNVEGNKLKGILTNPMSDDMQSMGNLENDQKEKHPLEAETNEISSSKPELPSQAPSISSSNPPSTSSLPTESSPSPDSPPGKIKVQILAAPSSLGLGDTPVGIVPGEDVQGNAHDTILHGELASYRKCSTGYSRDKKGRCRRVRRPVASQLPFGFGRIATNLATRLRLNPQDMSPSEISL